MQGSIRDEPLVENPIASVRLGIVISHYDDDECLERCLASTKPTIPQNIPPWFDIEVIQVSGRYTGFRDGSGNKGIPEKKKRQKCLDIAADKKCDFALVLDSDEFLDHEITHGVDFWSELAKDLHYVNALMPNKGYIYGVSFCEIKDFTAMGYTFRPRLIVHPEYVKYTDNHYTFNVKQIGYLNTPMTIYHDPVSCRGKKRMQNQERYRNSMPWIEK